MREGITHLRGVCSSRGRKACFLPLPQPPLPPGMDFCLAEASWDLAESGRRDAASSHGFGTEGAGRASLSNRALLRWARICNPSPRWFFPSKVAPGSLNKADSSSKLTGISTSSENYDGDGRLAQPLGRRHCAEVGNMEPTLSIITLGVLQGDRHLRVGAHPSPPRKGQGHGAERGHTLPVNPRPTPA